MWIFPLHAPRCWKSRLHMQKQCTISKIDTDRWHLNSNVRDTLTYSVRSDRSELVYWEYTPVAHETSMVAMLDNSNGTHILNVKKLTPNNHWETPKRIPYPHIITCDTTQERCLWKSAEIPATRFPACILLCITMSDRCSGTGRKEIPNKQGPSKLGGRRGW